MSVTAVPLHPLDKGTVPKLWIGLLIVVLIGIGLAWIGTSRQQIIEGKNGVTYRIFEAGEGDVVTPADVAMAHVETRSPKGEVLESTRQSGRPAPLTAETVPPWMNELFLQMRKGGSYQLFVPAKVLLNGQPLPPGGQIKEDDSIEFRVRVMEIERDGVARQQMLQEMQQQQMGGPGGPGGPGMGPGGPGGSPPPVGPAGR